jgi:Secretion system C-terminal sorting domain
MKKGLILAVCITQSLLLLSQTEKREVEMQRAAFESSQIMDPNTGRVPMERLWNAYNTTIKQQKQHRGKTLDWVELGPQNRVGGRVRALLIMPNQRKAFVGGITGGLWVTDDITTGVWRPVNDFFFNLNVSTIAIDPSDVTGKTLYFGTGEDYRMPTNQQASYVSDYNRGYGIWRSTDGGETWNHLTNTADASSLNVFYTVRKIVVNNQGDVFASTRNGIYKKTWNQTIWLWSLPEEVQANDLKMGTDGTIYATVGVGPDSEGKIYKLQPGRTTWELLNVVPTPRAFRRIELACSPSDANVIYMLAHTASTNRASVYKSSNKGATWNPIPLTGVNSEYFSQSFYALSIAVDPNDPKQVYIGSEILYRCSNTELPTQWVPINSLIPDVNYVHADVHQIVFRKDSTSIAYIATDGGLFRTAAADMNSISPTFVSINNNLRITQSYSVSASVATAPLRVLTGTQDNGTQLLTKHYLSNSIQKGGSDGGYCFVSPNNHLNQVSSIAEGRYNIYRYNGRNDLGAVGIAPPPNATRGSQLVNGTVNMFSDGHIYKDGVTDQENHFFRWNNIFGNTVNVTSFDNDPAFLGGGNLLYRISFIKVSPNSPNTVYIALSSRSGGYSRLIRMTEANSATPQFINIMGDLETTGYISSIAIKKAVGGTEDSEMVLTFSNYGIKNIWRTTNANDPDTAAVRWHELDISYQSPDDGRLPDMPIRYAIFPPESPARNPYGYKLLIATETGVWATKNFEDVNTKWYPINDNKLPNVRTQMLSYRESDGMLFVATLGRGVWSSRMFYNLDFGVRISRIPSARIGMPSECTLHFWDLSVNPQPNRRWHFNDDEVAVGSWASRSQPYCEEQKIRMAVNGDTIVKYLKDVLIMPTDCATCSMTADTESPFGGGVYLKKQQQNEKKDGTVQCYPNPNNGTFKVTIQSRYGTIETIELYNVTGKWIQTVPSATHEVNIEQEPAGIYICRVQTTTGEVLTGKIIKQ